MIDRFSFATSTEFVFGAGCRAQLPSRLAALGASHAVFVTDPGLVATGLVDPVEETLRAAGLAVTRFVDVKSNPTVDNVDAGAAVMRAVGADVVVALGGGSPIDAAKVMPAVAAGGFSAHDLMTGARRIEQAGAPVVVLPTTAGSGAEAAKVSVLVDFATGEKKGVFGPGTAPAVTFLDPELMLGLPRSLTAATGMDALSHALEAYLGLSANPFSDALAEQSMRLVARYLEAVVADGSDLEARGAMTIASALGGLAKDQSGLGVLHAVAMPIGYLYDLHHGYLCAALMPATLDANAAAVTEKTAWVARCFGGGGDLDDAAAAASAGDVIRALNQRIGMGMRLTEAGVKDDDLDRIVTDAMASYLLKNNPVPGSPELCRRVLVESL
jgi:alcohol dehydrogenase class IV